MRIETQVLVIGGGLTGSGILRDLTLRGVPAVLVERKDINAGASGANHGLLHSGGRYAVRDPASAAECALENEILKRVASGCIEPTGGLFVGLPDDPDEYAADFLHAATKVGIPAQPLSVAEALEREPRLNPNVQTVIEVPDAAINPFMATGANLDAATAGGAQVLLHTPVVGMKLDGRRVVQVDTIRSRTGELLEIVAEQIVSAAGPWVDQIGALAGVEIAIAYSKGSLLITNSRLVDHVINRLRPPSDADIIVPGETVTITGTTSVRVENIDSLSTGAIEVDHIIAGAAEMVPAMAEARYIRAYAGVRPLVHAPSAEGDRGLSRSFRVFDHAADGVDNLVTIAGGKLTTYRLMAEKTVDLVCHKLALNAPCRTAEVPLPGSEQGDHLDTAQRLERMQAAAPAGEVLCECEMISRSRVDDVVNKLEQEQHGIEPNAIRLRSRLGMGACQGGFCGFRTVGYLYERGLLRDGAGLEVLQDFLEKRWGGIKPMLWGDQLRQEQLLEAIYCGSLNIDGDL